MTFSQMQAAAPSRTSAWTPEREARALRLYLHEGFTASEVADALGGGFTRGAVIGKIRRLGYAKRERRPDDAAQAAPQRPCRGGPRVDRRMPPQRPPIPLPPLREVGASGVPTRLAGLSACACRWPLDDPGPGRMHLVLFCAGPAAAGSPYCAAHRALARR
jgi:GcrA cell cycle regulator